MESLRRRSTSRRPESPPGDTASIHGVVSHRHHVEGEDNSPRLNERKRSASVTGLLNKLLPSRRPERGGTVREKGFWEEQQVESFGQHYIRSPNKRPGLRPRHGSDSIASSAWNQPKSLPRRSQTSRAQVEKKPRKALASPPPERECSATPSTLTQGGRHRSDLQQAQIFLTDRLAARNITTRTTRTTTAAPQQSTDAAAPAEVTRSTVQDTLRLFDQKREARRLRRSLKDDRDYLGVQGVNPHTGVMDVITPTNSSPSDNTMSSLPELREYNQARSDFPKAYHRASRSHDAEEVSLIRLRKEQERLARLQRHKDTIRAFQHRVRWQKERNQWSSVAKPDLSPIADRSLESRSVSAGHTPITEPLPIRRGTKRAYSNPPASQTTVQAPTFTSPPVSPPTNRPDVVPQTSSETVIHTPVHGQTASQQRGFSFIADVLGEATRGSPPQLESKPPGPVKGPSSLPSHPTTDRVIRRKPIPVSSPVLQQQLKNRCDPPANGRQLVPPPVPSKRRDSFLEGGPVPESVTTYRFRDPATATSSKQESSSTQPERSQINFPSHFGVDVNVMSETVGTKDFADEKQRHAAFVNHLSHLDRPDSLPPAPVFTGRRNRSQSNSQSNVKSSSNNNSDGSGPPRKPLRYRVPLVPRRLGSKSEPKGTSTAQDAAPEIPPKSPEHLEISNPTLSRTTLLVTPMMTPAVTDDTEPTSGWAKQLIKDIEVVSRNPENARPNLSRDENLRLHTDLAWTRLAAGNTLAETDLETTKSASTPIITTTGYELAPMRQAQDLLKSHAFDGHVDDEIVKNGQVTRTISLLPPELIQIQVTETTEEDMKDTPALNPIQAQAVRAVEAVTDIPLLPKNTLVGPVFTPPPGTQNMYDLLASPPRLPPNVWPSLDIPVRDPLSQRPVTAPSGDLQQQRQVFTSTTAHEVRPSTAPEQRAEPEIATTSSAHQLRPTRQRYDRLCRRVSSLSPVKALVNRATSPTAASRDKSRERSTTRSDNTKTKAGAASPTSTSMYQQPHHNRSFTSRRYFSNSTNSHNNNNSSPTGSSSSSLITRSESDTPRRRKPAQEAARVALMGKTAAAAKIVQVSWPPSRKGSSASTTKGWTPRAISTSKPAGEKMGGNKVQQPADMKPAAAGDKQAQVEGQRDKKESQTEGGGDIGIPSKDEKKDGKLRKVPLRDGKTAATPSIFKQVGELMVRFVVGYWMLIAPVFNAGSPISKRLSARESTWHDCIVYLLALVYVLIVLLVTVWTVRGVVMVAGVMSAVSKGLKVLVGF